MRKCILILISVLSFSAASEDCGTDYMFPGVSAPLSTQEFVILAQDGPHHVILDHVVGPPPNNYQYILRLRLNETEMTAFKKSVAESKELAGLVTLTAFCPKDVKAIFEVPQDQKDPYSKPFPIKAAFLAPGAQAPSPVPEVSIERDDVEVMVFRYLPALLPQAAFRKALQERSKDLLPFINNAPLFANEPQSAASRRSSYITSDGAIFKAGESCPTTPEVKDEREAKTLHTFLLLAELSPTSVLAVHYMDQAPHNFQTAFKLRLSKKEMRIFRGAKNDTKVPPVMQTRILPKRNYYFCMADLPKLVKGKRFAFRGQVFRASTLDDYHLGKRIGVLDIMGSEMKIIYHRPIDDLQNPIKVAKSVLGSNFDRPAGFVDAKDVIPSLQVEMRYATEWNFIGKVINGYEAQKCLLTNEAAAQLSRVQGYVEAMGYSLLVFDCYRPQRAVDEFLKWIKDPSDVKMREVFYPAEPKADLVKNGYIDGKSGHSRGSTVDLTLVYKDNPNMNSSRVLRYQEKRGDCRIPNGLEETGQVNMGTTYDCFSDMSNTVNPQVPREASVNRQILKAAMEKFGFINYPKEWWHFTLRNEPFKKQYFDFVVK